MAAVCAAPVPSSVILGGDLRSGWSWQGSRQSGEMRLQAAEEKDLKKKMGGRDVSNASTAASECDVPIDRSPPRGVLSAAILGGDLRSSWSWQGTRQSGEKGECAAASPSRQQPSAALSDDGRPQGVLSAAILGDDARGPWSWQGACSSGEKSAEKPQPSAAVAADEKREGVPSSVILGDDFRGSWSWQGSRQSGEKVAPAAGAPVASPAGFDGVPSAAILGGDLRSSWSWQGSRQSGENCTSEKKDPAVIAEEQSSRGGVASSVILGASPDSGEAWKWR